MQLTIPLIFTINYNVHIFDIAVFSGETKMVRCKS